MPLMMEMCRIVESVPKKYKHVNKFTESGEPILEQNSDLTRYNNFYAGVNDFDGRSLVGTSRILLTFYKNLDVLKTAYVAESTFDDDTDISSRRKLSDDMNLKREIYNIAESVSGNRGEERDFGREREPEHKPVNPNQRQMIVVQPGRKNKSNRYGRYR
jgi:hypothetical protein